MSRRKRHDSEGGSPGWLTTYSDMVTLLLTFFVLLFTFSNVDAEKFKALAASLQFALNSRTGVSVFEGNPPTIDEPIEAVVSGPEKSSDDMAGYTLEVTSESSEEGNGLLNKEIGRIYKIVSDFVEEEGLEAEVKLRTDRRGVIIDINESILFDIGKAELKPDSLALLDKLTKLINSFDNNIIVEGHTDNMPISNSRFPTNWELSVIRATTVVRYFTEEKKIDPGRLSAAGYGEYRPIAPNDSEQNRALNRRVNMLIVASIQGGTEDGAGNEDKK